MKTLTGKQRRMLRRIAAAAALLVLLSFLPLGGWGKTAAYLLPYAVIGWDILYKAALGIVQGQAFDENFLMAVATIGAMALGDYAEGAAVMLFYQIGELFQSIAVGRSRRSIAALTDIRPELARTQRNGEWTELAPEEIVPGEVIEIRPGERVPLDGIVLSGESSLDTAALTGESLPRSVQPGDAVTSGCIDLSGVLRVRVTSPYGESTVARILDLVENASSRKSRSEAFITRFARVYTPAVCAAALVLALIPPLLALLSGGAPLWSDWLYRALTFLVISCPCALVISIPLGFFAGLGGASREGVLIKGSNYLEALSKTRTVVFDKTGTMTRGVFEVCGVHHNSAEPEHVLEIAALAELCSSHPIALSLRRAVQKPLDPARVSDIEERSGRGILAKVDGKTVAVGNGKLMTELGIEAEECRSVGTVVHVAVNGAYEGHILIADTLKPHAVQTVASLRRAGVQRLVMLTGDSESAARAAAEELGLQEVHASLLPGDKVARVETLLAERPNGETLAFVGDGINDAPVLTRADIGIAMGALGSDAAIEAADVVLMDDDPLRLVTAIRISRRCMRIVYENIAFALGVKLICLALGALGIAGMWLAIFADVGVMVLAVLNAIRAMATKSCREVVS